MRSHSRLTATLVPRSSSSVNSMDTTLVVLNAHVQTHHTGSDTIIHSMGLTGLTTEVLDSYSYSRVDKPYSCNNVIASIMLETSG